MLRGASLLGATLALAACGNRASPGSSAAATASVSARPPPTSVALEADPPTPLSPSNPLGLPPAKAIVEAGKRVFTFTEQTLASARIGATMALSAATVAGAEGDDLLIEGHDRPAYKVHPGYVIVAPDQPKLRIRDPVLTEQNGVMRHGVILRFVKERVAVRYTDAPGKASEALLLPSAGPPKQGEAPKAARFIRQVEGFAPGNYAALRRGDEWAHVLLVSSSGEGLSRRWFALGFGDAAMIVDESDLRPIPVKWSPKIGLTVWAEWTGTMRRAVVQSADEPGLYTVRFARAGRPTTVGWGLLMPVDR